MTLLQQQSLGERSSLSVSPGSPIENLDAEKTVVAKGVSATRSWLDRCGGRLRSGELVSFPTETVYGLGCHALDQRAVQKVFDAKERPLSDPLIVHVARSEDALALWAASSSPGRAGNTAGAPDNTPMQQQIIEKQALSTLTDSFFPGPLTLVARAHPSVPQILMADTGYVACRSPSHPVARALLRAAGVPIAAPSANKFGHVSPTTAAHVLDDLGQEDVWVVDPDLGVEHLGSGDDDTVPGHVGVCQVGVESTVAKIEMNSNGDGPSKVLGRVTIIRHGAVSSQAIRGVLAKANLSQYIDVSDSITFTSDKVPNVAPGQTAKHYSPNVACFMISSFRQRQSANGEHLEPKEDAVLSQSVIVDYGKRLARYQTHALAYRDLSPAGNPTAAASHLFETLRWSETVQGATRVFVPELVLGKNELEGEDQALVLAVKDKLTRAASAVVCNAFQ